MECRLTLMMAIVQPGEIKFRYTIIQSKKGIQYNNTIQPGEIKFRHTVIQPGEIKYRYKIIQPGEIKYRYTIQFVVKVKQFFDKGLIIFDKA